MTSVVVFLGPTLPVEEARAVLDAEYLPPAAQGDVLRAALRRPTAIALIDGVFEGVPAVWHKEILFALSEGIHVYGAASMGALRAAELDQFGMRGIGDVYRGFADGELEDDDEVAVGHGDAEHGYRAISDAMVDVRATLDAAAAEGVLTGEVAAALTAGVKAAFYPQRLLLSVLDPDNEEHEGLRRWLPTGWVHRKGDDALVLLRTVRDELRAGLEPFRPDWSFQRTRYWVDARGSVETAVRDQHAPVSAHVAVEELEAVLDEVRLDPARYRRLLDRSLLIALTLDAASAAEVDVSPWARQAALDRERQRRGLLRSDDAAAWLGEMNLTETDLPDVARRLAALSWARQAYRDRIAGEVALSVRSDDAYAALVARSCQKREFLATRPAISHAGRDDDEVISWYFHERLGREIPVALGAWASAHGWRHVGDLTRAARAEFWFTRSFVSAP